MYNARDGVCRHGHRKDILMIDSFSKLLVGVFIIKLLSHSYHFLRVMREERGHFTLRSEELDRKSRNRRSRMSEYAFAKGRNILQQGGSFESGKGKGGQIEGKRNTRQELEHETIARTSLTRSRSLRRRPKARSAHNSLRL